MSVPSSVMAKGMGMFTVPHTISSALCCKCGVMMQPNAANMCARCLRSVVDITEGLQKRVNVVHCPECDSYLEPQGTWLAARLESTDLMTFCLAKLKNLKKTVHVVDAKFIWTEPHSKRIKLKLTVQKQVLHGVILEQAYTVEYVVQDQMCLSCFRVQACDADQWEAVVQLRQDVPHKRTLLYVEQLILRHDAAKHALWIKQMGQGIDFFFKSKSQGKNLVEFLRKVSPVRVADSEKLVSHDSKSNKGRYRYTFSVEISPISREDLICLPLKVSVSWGNLGPLVICNKVSNNVDLLDPFTLRQHFLTADQYWRLSFKALLSSRQLVDYIVLDVEAVSPEVIVEGVKYALAHVQVARVSDFGKNDTIFSGKTHLGHLLTCGDHALGYDLHGVNVNDVELDKYSGLELPDVVLIRKSYESRGSRDNEENSVCEEILRDVEENCKSLSNLCLNSGEVNQQLEMDFVSDGEEVPAIQFAGLNLGFEEGKIGDDSMELE